MLDPIQVDAEELAESSLMNVTLDFVMTQVITLVGELDQTTVSDEELITSFDLTQNASDLPPGTPGYGESGFMVDAEVELITIELIPAP